MKKFVTAIVLAITVMTFGINIFAIGDATTEVNLRVEGLTDTIMSGNVQVETVAKAIQKLGNEYGVEVIMTSNSTGQELYSISGIKNNTYDLNDRWRSYIIRKQNIIHIENIDNTSLVSGDELIVYYGNNDTKIVTDKKETYSDGKLTIELISSVITWVEDNGVWGSKAINNTLENINIVLSTGDGKIKTGKTNSENKVSFDLKSPNIYTYYAEGTQENNPPLIVKTIPVSKTLGIEEKNELTKAETTALLVNYFGVVSKGVKQNFEDVTEQTNYKPQIDIATSAGIINGDGKGKFNPDEKITVEKAVIILNNIFKNGAVKNKKIDLEILEGVSDWARESVTSAMKQGLIKTQAQDWTAPITVELLKSMML